MQQLRHSRQERSPRELPFLHQTICKLVVDQLGQVAWRSWWSRRARWATEHGWPRRSTQRSWHGEYGSSRHDRRKHAREYGNAAHGAKRAHDGSSHDGTPWPWHAPRNDARHASPNGPHGTNDDGSRWHETSYDGRAPTNKTITRVGPMVTCLWVLSVISSWI
nr:uncharacterized protein LOC113830429 isoform X1 [Penaeus vannamei]